MSATSIPTHHALLVLALVGALAGASGCARSRSTDDPPTDGGPHDAGPPDAGPGDAGRDAGGCESDDDCDDGAFCTGREFCDPGSRTCRTSAPPDCQRALCFRAFCDTVADTCRPPDDDMDGDAVLGCGGGRDCDDGNPLVSSGAAERCANAQDDDCDGLRDCVDPDCDGDPACAACDTTPNELDCDDGLDDDCDGLFDEADPDCCVPRAGGEVCMNGVDGDCDGLLVCDDPDCADVPDCRR